MSNNKDIAADLAAKLDTKEKTWSEPGKKDKPLRVTTSVRLSLAHKKTIKLMAVEFDTSGAEIIEAAIDLLTAADKDKTTNLAELVDTAQKKLK